MNKIYYMDDILDGEFEYQTVREVLSDNRTNILNLCNKGYLFDKDVLDRAGIKSESKNIFGADNINVIYISHDKPYLEDIIHNRPIGTTVLNNFKKSIDNKHFPDSLSEEDEMGYNFDWSLPCGEYAQDAFETELYQSLKEKYDDNQSYYED